MKLPPLKPRGFFLLGAILFALVALLLTWPSTFGLRRTFSLESVRAAGERQLSAPLPSDAQRVLAGDPVRIRAAQVWEDGRALPHANTPRVEIERLGGGRYRVTKNRVWFSASDDTRATDNQRRYALVLPLFQSSPWVPGVAWILALQLAWLAFVRPAAPAPRSVRPPGGTHLEAFCRFLRPAPYFAGVLLGISLAAWAGSWAARQDVYGDRSRFFFQISSEGNVFPTLENLRQFVRGKADPDKILVLVGGSSVMLGVGQTNDQLWTDELQRVLGGQFCVVNVGFRAAFFMSAAVPLAESLAAEYPRIILAVDTVPARPLEFLYGPHVPGYPYDYLPWQAWTAGALGPHPKRDAALRAALRSSVEADRLAAQELWLRGLFERFSHSSDLWNLIGYRHFFTVYSRIGPPGTFFQPRRSLADDEFLPPAPAPVDFAEQRRVREDLEKNYLARVVPTASGSPAFEPSADVQIAALRARLFSGTFSAQPLFLVLGRRPDGVAALSEPEQARYAYAITGWVQALRDAGFAALPIGLDYPVDAFRDSVHFSNAAAPRLAREVGAEVEAIARREHWIDEN